jgi:hypothetical protein
VQWGIARAAAVNRERSAPLEEEAELPLGTRLHIRQRLMFGERGEGGQHTTPRKIKAKNAIANNLRISVREEHGMNTGGQAG